MWGVRSATILGVGRRIFAGLTLALGLILASQPFAQSGSTIVLKPAEAIGGIKRFAVVIGNGAYQNVQQLRNPKNDAAAVAAKLQRLGYTVVYGHDLDRRAMNQAVETFLSMIEPGSEALVYYSGHGVDLNGSNYLLPTDIPVLEPDQEWMLREEGMNVTDLLLNLQERSARVNVVILDACRDNPFRAVNAAGLTRSLGETRGLAAVEPPRGSFIMFAAGVGEQALDNLGSNDTNPNGLFTRKLLALMDQDGLEIRSLMLRLRTQVQEAALQVDGHIQVPGYYDQLLGEFYFRPKPMQPAEQTACEILVDDNASKEAILAKDVDAGVQACARAVADHPADARLTRLLQAAEEQRAFQQAMRSIDRGPSEAYLVRYPAGRFATDVKGRLASLGHSPTPGPVQPAPLGPVEGPKPTVDQADIARVLQAELKRVGCDPDFVDGVWGASSERALGQFNRQTHSSFDVDVASLEAIEAVRSKTERICPPTCGSGERLAGDQCVRLTCRHGLHLSGIGTCVADLPSQQRAASNPRPRAAAEFPPPNKVRRRPAESATGSDCFTFNGERFCN